jgi:CTP:molybdopterin cytidylyltransferase MocA
VAVLAAGRGSRFGGAKLDALCAGKPVGRWVLDAVAEAGLPPGLLILPPRDVSFIADAAGWQRQINPRADRGIGTSLALAATWALDRDAPALLVLLADMPLIGPAYLRLLCAALPPAATAHAHRRPGVPALLSPALLRNALGLTGDEGAARLLASARSLTLLDAPPGTLSDIDRPEDIPGVEKLLHARLQSHELRKGTPR